MASHAAISTVSLALRGLLEAHLRAEFGNNHSCSLLGLNATDPPQFGLTLTLYRITLNASLRNRSLRPGSGGTPVHASALPLDLHYLLAAWATQVDQQHLLLGWAMRFLDDHPSLPAAVLNDFGPQPPVFRGDESVELICSPPELAEYLQLWDKVKTLLPLSVGYIARTLLIESAEPATLAPAVRTRALVAGVQEPLR